MGTEKAQTVDYDRPLTMDVRVKHAASLPRQPLQIQRTPFTSRELPLVVLLRLNALFSSPVLCLRSNIANFAISSAAFALSFTRPVATDVDDAFERRDDLERLEQSDRLSRLFKIFSFVLQRAVCYHRLTLLRFQIFFNLRRLLKQTNTNTLLK